MTPRGYLLHIQQVRAQKSVDVRIVEILLAQVTAMIGNTGFRGFEEPLRAEQFFLSPELRPKPKKRKKEDIASLWRDSFRAMAQLPKSTAKFR